MTTPPRVHPDDVADAIFRIHDRHRRYGDPHRHDLTEDPAQILSYLRKHATRLADGLRADDLLDAGILHVWLWWEASRRELFWFEQAAKLGQRAEFAKLFGIGSPAGFNNRRDRLHGLHDDTGLSRPDEKAVMRDRVLLAAGTGPVDWYTANRQPMRELARLAVALEPRVDDDTAGVLSDVGEELAADRWDDTAFGVLTMAVTYLEDCDDLAGSPELDEVRRRYVALRVDRKRAESPPT